MIGRRIGWGAACLLLSAATIAGVVAVAPAAEREVRIVADNRYEPRDKFIEVGDTVLWRYDDANGAPHSVTRTSNPERFDSSPSNCPQTNPLQQSDCLTSNNRTYSHRFDTPGTYSYFCKVHGQSMSGVIHVAPKPTATATPTPTKTSVSPSPSASPSGSGSPSPGDSLFPSGSPGPTETPTPAPSESPLPPPSGGSGAGGKAALALLALGALGGAGYLIYRRFLA